MGPLEKLNGAVLKVERVLITLFLLVMVVMAFMNVVLRNISAFYVVSWFDSLTRQLVLVVSLLGASIASDQLKHINIDLVSRFVPKGALRWVQLVCMVASITLCAIFVWASARYTLGESEEVAFTIAAIGLDVKMWWFIVFIPLSFSLASLHFAVNIVRLLGDRAPPPLYEEEAALSESLAASAASDLSPADDTTGDEGKGGAE